MHYGFVPKHKVSKEKENTINSCVHHYLIHKLYLNNLLLPYLKLRESRASLVPYTNKNS